MTKLVPEVLNEHLAGAIRVLRGMKEGETMDPKLWPVRLPKTSLGEKALQYSILGLSRPVKTTREDTELLISHWEMRDEACCFSGSTADLLSLKGTLIMALSYKHDDRSNWGRKGIDGVFSKMTELDQQALIESIVGLGSFPETSHVIVWCDQILNLRIESQKIGGLAWHNAGLLPYICFPVLSMSTYIPERALESRIWIRAERSLARRGTGLLSIERAKLGLPSTKPYRGAPWDALYYIALFILSEYWPPDTEYWQNAYNDMKIWALSLVCRTDKVIDLKFEDTVTPVDNLEILSNLHDLVEVPQEVKDEGKPFYTGDHLFFLKATAWNLSLEDVWNNNRGSISHYLSTPVHYKFSWWIEAASETMCGFLAMEEAGCFILAVKEGEGYKVFRRVANPAQYRHKERILGPKTKKLIDETALRYGIEVDTDSEWSLRYCCDDRTDAFTMDAEVQSHMGVVSTESDAVVPNSFFGLSTCLYRASAAIRRSDCPDGTGPRRFLSFFEAWNSHVKKNYEHWLTIRDTRSGPIWLEGYTEEYVSFGFLDFLTRKLFAPWKYFSDRTVKLPSKWEAVQELRRNLESAGDDLKLLGKELFGEITEHNCEKMVKTSEVARLMLCGGFTSDFSETALSNYLTKTAQLRGYWSTEILCRGGKIQIIFENGSGNVRIIQRQTQLDDFEAVGAVPPEDSMSVITKADILAEVPQVYRAPPYWKLGMEDNATKANILFGFPKSLRKFHGKFVSLVDMTVGSSTDTDSCSVHYTSKHDSELPSSKERLLAMEKELLSFASKEQQEQVLALARPSMTEITQKLRKEKELGDDLFARAYAAMEKNNKQYQEIRQRKLKQKAEEESRHEKLGSWEETKGMNKDARKHKFLPPVKSDGLQKSNNDTGLEAPHDYDLKRLEGDNGNLGPGLLKLCRSRMR